MIKTRSDLIHAIDALPVSRITKKTYYISINNGYLINENDIKNRIWTLKELDEPFIITDPLLREIEDVSSARRQRMAERDHILALSRSRADGASKVFGRSVVQGSDTGIETHRSKGR